MEADIFNHINSVALKHIHNLTLVYAIDVHSFFERTKHRVCFTKAIKNLPSINSPPSAESRRRKRMDRIKAN